MDQAPLVRDEIDAGEAFIKEMNAAMPVAGACWVTPTEDGERYLYVVVKNLTEDTVDAAYGEVLRIAIQLKDQQYFDPFRVRIIGPDDPIARALLEIYQRCSGPTRYDGRVFGGQAVAEVYVYPQTVLRP